MCLKFLHSYYFDCILLHLHIGNDNDKDITKWMRADIRLILKLISEFAVFTEFNI